MSGLRRIGLRNLSILCMSVLSACGNKPPQVEQPPPAAAPAATAPAAVESKPAAPATPESGLAIKRGTVSLVQDHYQFQPCPGGARWSLQGDEALEVLKGFSSAGPRELFIEARGEFAPQAAGAVSGDLVVQELLYAAPVSDQIGCNSPAADYKVWARNSEPQWSLKARNDGMTLTQADSAPRDFTLVEGADTEGAVVYRATTQDGHKLELAVTQQPCRDSKAGEYFRFTANVTLDEQHLTGCAKPGE